MDSTLAAPDTITRLQGGGTVAPEDDRYDAVPVGLVTVDRRLFLRQANDQGRRLLGLHRQSVRGGRRLLDGLAREDRDRLLGAMASAAVARGLSCGEVSVAVPGRPRRILWVEARQTPAGDEVMLALVDVTDTRARAERVEQQALHDELTGLPNRRQALDFLERALHQAHESGGRVGALFIDLDRFKLLNDSLGHEAGDGLLREVATRLRSTVGSGGLTARLGGDEFLVVLPVLGRDGRAVSLAQRLLRAIARPWVCDGHTVAPGASIGLSCYPDDAQDAPGLLRAADRALYRAKRDGRHACRRYDACSDGEGTPTRQLRAQLQRALQREELRLHYQPQVALRGGALCGLGVLLHWAHPERGLLASDRFMPIAEQAGLAARIDQWVLQEAAGQWRRWQAEGRAPARLSVKLAPGRLEQPGWQARLAGLVGPGGLPPQVLQVEFDDAAVAAAPAPVIGAWPELRRLGLGLALNRVGEGASCLARLPEIGAQMLRIGRSLVAGLPADPASVTMVQALVAMARPLGVRMLADGVESAAQRDCLAACGVDECQGHLLSRPLPAAELDAWLGGRTPAA
jgi:diguanylate cyclase (GGDEF)-like protein